MSPRRRVALTLTGLALLLALLAAGLTHDRGERRSALLGKAAPAFALPRLDAAGATFSPAELRGRVWLLNVWASWCTACAEEHPTLLRLARRATLVGLAYKDGREPALAWLARRGDPYRASVLDADGRVGVDYGVYGVPETFVIGRDGRVLYRHAGPLNDALVERDIAPLLEAP